MIPLHLAFLYFILYSVIGWLCETIFCSVGQRKFVNRGFLNGPICPIYGVGALLVLYLFQGFANNILLLFLASMVATSIVEYITSFLLEKLFHLTLWDYSNRPFNINGRVCLRNSLLFGLMAVILVHFIHPAFEKWMDKIPQSISIGISIFLFIILLIDCIFTVRSMLQLHGKLNEIHNLFEELGRKTSIRLQELQKQSENRSSLTERIEQINKRLTELKTEHRHAHGRIVKAFPNMKSPHYQDALDQIKREIKKRKTKIP